jgi:hypothetical protein
MPRTFLNAVLYVLMIAEAIGYGNGKDTDVAVEQFCNRPIDAVLGQKFNECLMKNAFYKKGSEILGGAGRRPRQSHQSEILSS